MKHTRINFKSGATSFYVVAISTLILVILATSFATAIMAEIVRSANDDLAQSAYDSALAGIEEAKLAYANYQNCINRGEKEAEDMESLKDGEISCPEIIYWMNHPDCDMVARILGRISDTDAGREINLEETATGSTNENLDQAYTCVEVNVSPQDVYGTLSISSPFKIINVDNIHSPDIDSVILRWHVNKNDQQIAYTNIIDDKKVGFPSVTKIGNFPTPATIAFQVIQTSSEGFTFGQLSGASSSGASDRATMYFVPTGNKDLANASAVNSANANYIGLYDGNKNIVSKYQVSSTNNHQKNYPYLVYCDTDKPEDFACSVQIDLPKPINGEERDNDTFAFILSLPYVGATTQFSLNYLCYGAACTFDRNYSGGDTISAKQIVIDSTGRANDMYKRMEVRLDAESPAQINGYPFYAIQADTIYKDFPVNTEFGVTNIPDYTPDTTDPIECKVINDSNVMQDWDNCTCLATNETRSLVDIRDNQVYPIAKLTDGKCWMTMNLNLAGGTTISSVNSNITGSYTLPASKNIFNPTQDNKTAGLFNSKSTNCSSAVGCYSYYTFPAATAGTGVSISSGDAESDICPKGWRLPTTGEFDVLVARYNTTAKLAAAPFRAVYAGFMIGNSVNPRAINNGTSFSYWSSTADDIDYGEGLYASDGSRPSRGHSSKGVGLPIRCIKK